MSSPAMGTTAMVKRRPVLAAALTPRDQSTSLSASLTSVPLCRWLTLSQMEATRAAMPEASFTTKVCMEKITLSSRRSFFSSP